MKGEGIKMKIEFLECCDIPKIIICTFEKDISDVANDNDTIGLECKQCGTFLETWPEVELHKLSALWNKKVLAKRSEENKS